MGPKPANPAAQNGQDELRAQAHTSLVVFRGHKRYWHPRGMPAVFWLPFLGSQPPTLIFWVPKLPLLPRFGWVPIPSWVPRCRLDSQLPVSPNWETKTLGFLRRFSVNSLSSNAIQFVPALHFRHDGRLTAQGARTYPALLACAARGRRTSRCADNRRCHHHPPPRGGVPRAAPAPASPSR